SNTQVVAIAPPGPVGTVDVTVTTFGGTTAISAADQFTYVTAPVVSGLSIVNGSTGGGYPISIFGSNFLGASAVSFGSSAATSFTVVSASQINAVVPAHIAGPVAATVTNNGLKSVTNSTVDQFLYVLPATVSSVTPAKGSTT